MSIMEFRAQGLSIREIARKTGYSRNTVRKYLRLRQTPKRKPRSPRLSKLDPFKSYTRDQMSQGVFNCNRLLRDLKSQGYSGGKSILKDFVKPFRPAKVSKSVVRFETKPGEQAQVDFGSFLYEDEHGRHRLSAFVMVLSYSRALYVEFVERQDLSTLLGCMMRAFEALGGIPRTVVFDNMKPVVVGRESDGSPKWNTGFLDFALRVGFRPWACRPYRAQTKGRVERAIGYLRGNFWPGLVFSTLEDLNGQAHAWTEGVANKRVHGTTGRRPVDLLPEEDLLPVPSDLNWRLHLGEERRVSRDGFVSYGGSRYGVPSRLAGRWVTVRESGHHIEILTSGVKVALHPRAVLPRTTVPMVGQWDDVSLADNARKRQVVAIRVPGPEVEVRSLSAYESLIGGESRDRTGAGY